MAAEMELDTELAMVHIFSQEIMIKEEPETQTLIDQYVQTALDTFYIERETENDHGPFYKVQLHHNKEKSDDKMLRYIIDFHLVSLNNWEEKEISRKLKEIIPKPSTIISERLIRSLHSMTRNPVCTDALWEDEDPGCVHITGSNWFSKFLNWWLIVPRTQWAFHDLVYQMYTFDITHQGFVTKLIHFFTIPMNAMLTMMFLAQFNVPFLGECHYGNAFAVNAALLFFTFIGLIYIIVGFLRRCWLWGLSMFLILGVLTISGNMWYYSFRHDDQPWYNPTSYDTNPIIWSYIVSLIQATSHVILPQIPPNITGVPHWESFHLYLMAKRKSTSATVKHLFFLIASCLSFPFFSVAVTWFSWPHLLGTEVIYIMAGIGYKKSFFEKFYRIVEKAELLGSPILDKFPMKYEDLRLAVRREAVKEKFNCTPQEV